MPRRAQAWVRLERARFAILSTREQSSSSRPNPGAGGGGLEEGEVGRPLSASSTPRSFARMPSVLFVCLG